MDPSQEKPISLLPEHIRNEILAKLKNNRYAVPQSHDFAGEDFNSNKRSTYAPPQLDQFAYNHEEQSNQNTNIKSDYNRYHRTYDVINISLSPHFRESKTLRNFSPSTLKTPIPITMNMAQTTKRTVI
jgi:hypothetical protein